MEKRDAWKLNAEANEEIQRQAVKLHRDGKTNSEIASFPEVHRNTVSGRINRYKRDGARELEARKVGRKVGGGMQLDDSEQKTIRKQIVDATPEQLKMPFALWTREAAGRLIEEKTGKRFEPRQTGRYLKRWGFTPQRRSSKPISAMKTRLRNGSKKRIRE